MMIQLYKAAISTLPQFSLVPSASLVVLASPPMSPPIAGIRSPQYSFLPRPGWNPWWLETALEDYNDVPILRSSAAISP